MSLILSDLQNYMNIAVTCALEALEKEGKLNQPAKEIATEYVIVLHEKGVLGRFLDKLWHREKDDGSFIVRYAKFCDENKIPPTTMLKCDSQTPRV